MRVKRLLGLVHMIKSRCRNFLPVVIDVETGGFNEKTDALLEVAAVFITMNSDSILTTDETCCYQIKPFAGANIEPAALKVNKIDPHDSSRNAIPETEALKQLFNKINKELKATECSKAILVGHNAFFDLKFIKAAADRCDLKYLPIHSFSNLDTVTLGALTYGETVLSKIAQKANIPWDERSAHSASYDAKITAKIFCQIFNQWPI